MGDPANPMVALAGFSAVRRMKWCSMHVCNLGIGQIHNGGALEKLIMLSGWALQDLMNVLYVYGVIKN